MSYLSTEEIIYNLSNYAVVSLIRSGRVADTYHVKKENQNDSIRILKPELIADTDSVLQFKNEYRALKSLQHDSFLTMLEWGDFQGVSYTVSEYFPHTTLRDYVLSHTLAIHEKDEIIQQLITAVHVMHHQGMIHFGIKPSNVLYHDGKIKLIQLGQVRFSNQTLEYPAPLITAEYAEPELIASEIEISTSADIYAILSLMKFLHVGNEEHLNQDLEDPQQQAFFQNYFHAPYAQRPKTCEELLACLQGGKVATAQEIQPQQEVKEVSPINTSSGWLKKSILIASVVALTCLGFYYFNKGSVHQPEGRELLAKPGRPSELNEAQLKFWKFIETYRDEGIAESTSNLFEAKGEAPKFIYLKESEKSVIGNKKGAEKHIELFKERYSWVQPLLDKYEAKLSVNAEFEGTPREISLNYYYQLNDIILKEEGDEQRRAYVQAFLNASLIADYLMAKGSDTQRKASVEILKLIIAPMRFDTVFSKHYSEMEIPALESIFWPALAAYPEEFDNDLTSLISPIFVLASRRDKNLTKNYFNFLLWRMRDSKLACWSKPTNNSFVHTTIQNMLADMGERKYAFYWVHVGMDGPLKKDNHGIAKYILKKIHKNDFQRVLNTYNTLLENAYPKKSNPKK